MCAHDTVRYSWRRAFNKDAVFLPLCLPTSGPEKTGVPLARPLLLVYVKINVDCRDKSNYRSVAPTSCKYSVVRVWYTGKGGAMSEGKG